MEKQRKDDHKAAVDIDTNPPNIKFGSFGNRAYQELPTWNSRFFRFFYYLYDTPTSFIHSKIKEIRGERPIYYHRKFKRVPTVDECYTDDLVCIYEANQQLKRDLAVDQHIIKLLKDRFFQCVAYHTHDDAILCENIRKSINDSEYNFELKYGELGSKTRAQDCYMKQKHRMIMERRKEQSNKVKTDDSI